MTSENSVKVLYIIGFRRSGSTLLDIILGNHSGIESTGELAHISHNGWLGNQCCSLLSTPPLGMDLPPEVRQAYLARCSCGEHVNSCSFWSEVRRAWIARVSADDADRYAELQAIFHSHRKLPRMLIEKYRPSSQFQAYARLNRALFEAIREVSGKPVVLDSSKNKIRALALSMTPGIDLHLVHLVRDVRGVAASLKKTRSYNRSIWYSAGLWIGANILSELVRSQLTRSKTVGIRYEDLITTPNNTLDTLGQLINLNLTEIAKKISAGETMEVGHNVSGNRLRMTSAVRIQPGVAKWEDALSTREQRILWFIAGWLMKRYGYKARS